ncbi:MAG: hypothetical protein AB7T49_17980 [Oligoflexales bacterium]
MKKVISTVVTVVALIAVVFACKKRASDLANAQDHNSHDVELILQGEHYTCSKDGDHGSSVNNVVVNYFDEGNCTGGLMMTSGHEGKNLANYCTLKGSQVESYIESIKIGAECIKTLNMKGVTACKALAVEEDSSDKSQIRAYDDSSCKTLLGILGEKGELTIEEYCAAKAVDTSGALVESFKTNNGQCESVTAMSLANFCKQFAI